MFPFAIPQQNRGRRNTSLHLHKMGMRLQPQRSRCPPFSSDADLEVRNLEEQESAPSKATVDHPCLTSTSSSVSMSFTMISKTMSRTWLGIGFL